MVISTNSQSINDLEINNQPSRDDLALVLSHFTDNKTACELSDQTNQNKSHSIEVSKFLSNDKISKCSNFIDVVGKSVVSLTRCNQYKFCLTCNHKRANQLYYAVKNRTEEIKKDHPKLKAYHLVLTGGSTTEFSSIKNRLKKINEGWTRFKSKLKGSITGYIKCNEISESNNKAHVHSHIIILTNTELYKDNLESIWTKVLKSKKGRIKIDLTPIDCKGESLGSIVKYASKAITDPRNKILNINFKTIADQLINTRLLSTGGLFKGVFKKEEHPAIDVKPQFKFNNLSKRYKFTVQEKDFKDEFEAEESYEDNFETDKSKQLELNLNNQPNPPTKDQSTSKSKSKYKSKPKKQSKQLSFKFIKPPKTPHWVHEIKQNEHPLLIQAGSGLELNKIQDVYYNRTEENKIISKIPSASLNTGLAVPASPCIQPL